MEFDKELIDALLKAASSNRRKRQNHDLRTAETDTSQRMLNAILPGSDVPIHRHRNTSETVVCLCGKMDEIIYTEESLYVSGNGNFPLGIDAQSVQRKSFLREAKRICLCPAEGRFGCQIPKGVWHTVEIIEPSVIFEAKDGAYSPFKQEDVWNDKEED